MKECSVSQADRGDGTPAPHWCHTHTQRHYACLAEKLKVTELQVRALERVRDAALAYRTVYFEEHGQEGGALYEAFCEFRTAIGEEKKLNTTESSDTVAEQQVGDFRKALEEIRTEASRATVVSSALIHGLADKALRRTHDSLICEGCEKGWERWPDADHHRRPGDEAVWVPCLRRLDVKS